MLRLTTIPEPGKDGATTYNLEGADEKYFTISSD